jgi:hypothetical protein
MMPLRYMVIHGLFDKIPGVNDKHHFELVRWRSGKIEANALPSPNKS